MAAQTPVPKMPMQDYSANIQPVILFGPFRVVRAKRLLERNGEAVRLGGRAFDVLVYLLDHAGQVVSHRTLLEAVWSGTCVAEGTLRFQMACVRKALGGGEASYITSVPGRGYCFTAPISKRGDVKHPPPIASNAIGQPRLAAPQANEDLLSADVLPYPPQQPLIKKSRETVSADAIRWEERCATDICDKLDDLAFALEMAASHVRVLGIDKLSDLLDRYWITSWPGRDETSLRHQTLYAMLDWSYRLLSEKEKRVFQYISVFCGQFDLEAASAVIDKDVEAEPVLDDLASKSLLSLNQSNLGKRYCLFDTVKCYARGRLAEANQVREARHRHAMFFMQVLQTFKSRHSTDQSLSKLLTSDIDDVLAAVIWGFTQEHDSLPARRILEQINNFEPSLPEPSFA